MADEKKPLNLDELFGQARNVSVVWNQKTYELIHLEGMSSRQYAQFQKLYARANDLQSLSEDVTDEEAGKVEAVMNDLLTLVCPDMPVNELTFVKKIRVLQFYIEETQGKKVMELALQKVKQPTGARSSHK